MLYISIECNATSIGFTIECECTDDEASTLRGEIHKDSSAHNIDPDLDVVLKAVIMHEKKSQRRNEISRVLYTFYTTDEGRHTLANAYSVDRYA